MATKIARRHPDYAYMFDAQAYRKFDPSKHPIVKEVEADLKLR